MAEEEHIPSSSHSGGGGGDGGGVSSDRSRNVKRKKVPQRGLGVAQLEKIRLEEQRKKEALEAANSIGSVNDSHSPSPANLQSPNTLYRSSPPIPIQISDGVVEDTNFQAISSSRNDSWPRFWGGEHSHRNDYLAAAPMPSLPQRSFIFHQPVVNPSTLLTSYMEPPSNQNIHSSNYAFPWPEEYKLVGMKRPYPFSIESPPARSVPVHFDPPPDAPKSRFDELPSCSSGYNTAQTEARNIYISLARDDRSNTNPLPKQSPAEGRLNGDFLTLAPPAAALPSPYSNHKYRLDDSGFVGPEENMRNQVQEPFNFFPVRLNTDEAAVRVTGASGENGETIDLNLKL